MACDVWRERLEGFVDGELPPEAAREFAGHLRGCLSCAADIAGRQRLNMAVKRAAQGRFAPSAKFRNRIATQLGEEKRAARTAWIWSIVAAAAVFLLVLLWFAPLGKSPANSTFSEVVDLHVATLASASPVDVVSTDLHTVKPWFEGKLPFAVNPPDLANTPFTLLGGRVAYLNQAPGAALLFQFRKHRLSTFVFQDRPILKSLGEQNEPKQYASFWIETWEQSGLRYFAIGDTSAENVKQLANLIRRAASVK